jgi:hypothetical protein
MFATKGSVKMEQKAYQLWSPITWDQAKVSVKYQDHVINQDLTFVAGPHLAEWNLMWLFSFDALSQLNGTLSGYTAMYKALKGLGTSVAVSIREDVGDDFYGMKEMAETCMPVEFITSFLRKPYTSSMMYKMANETEVRGGDKIFEQARINAPKLEAAMLGEAEIDDRGIPIPIPEARRRAPPVTPERKGNIIHLPFGRRN